jgi:hypothetical protein
MTYKFPKLPLNRSEKVWLSELVDTYLSGAPFDRVRIRVKLNKKLDPNFVSSQMDNRLFIRNDSTPSLWGIWHVDPNHRLLGLVDKVIRQIKKQLSEDSPKFEIDVETLSSSLGNTPGETVMALEQLTAMSDFWSGAQADPQTNKINKIYFNSESSVSRYLNYSDLDAVMKSYYKVEKKSKKLLNYAPLMPNSTVSYIERDVEPKTAFIIMHMDKSKPELQDVCNTIKEVCSMFDIKAERVDDIEDQDKITDTILKKIHSSEYLIADLTGERPNVYYEVGYAHSLNKKPILFRRQGTRLHFDLSVHMVREYENITNLKMLLTKRLEAIVGRVSKKKK